MTQPHPSAHAGDLAVPRFVTLSVTAAAAGAGPADVVLARTGDPLRPDALVVAREPLGYAVRRVARVTDDAVELLGDRAGEVRRMPRDGAEPVVGTVLLRWHVESAA